jgi:uncharacterized protein (DUF305 family)
MNEKITYGIIGLLAGIIITLAITSITINKQGDNDIAGMHNMMGGSSMMNRTNDNDYDNTNMQNMHESMRGMMQGINNKTGDEFDKAFISEMILHHEGAIDMANQALLNAKHQEIKDLAKAIISAQTKEITQMKEWQNNWYK